MSEKGGESKWFRMDSGVRQVCIMSPWLIYGYSDDKGEDEDRKEGSETPGGGERVEITWSCMQMTWFCVMSRITT